MDSSLLIAALQQLLKRFFRAEPAEPAEALIEWKGEAQLGGGVVILRHGAVMVILKYGQFSWFNKFGHFRDL